MWNVHEPGTAKMPRPCRNRQPIGGPPRPTVPPRLRFGFAALTAGLVVLGGLLHAIPVQAIEIGGGEIQGNLDTTISHGMTFRVEKRNAGLAADTNGNDGDLNYNRGIVSNTSKFTTDLDVGSGDFGAFIRATGFIDFENQNGTRERTPLSDAAKDKVGKDLEVLDAYVTGTFDAGDSIVDMRLGRHVLNWGESTFIPNGINAINHFDVSKLRLPGSELREALLPVGLASLSVAPTDTLSVEGFYQLEWQETEIDPVGSYFSSTDYVGPGAREAVIPLPGVSIRDTGLGPDSMIGFEPLIPAINADLKNARDSTQATLEQQLGLPPGSLAGRVTIPSDQATTDPDFLSVLRGPDDDPDDSGQWGLALRYLAEELNDTEFGFYFVNYHSRLPVVGATAGSREGIQAGLAAAGAIARPGSATSMAIGSLVTPAVTQAITQLITRTVTESVPSGTPQPVINQLVDTELAKPETQQLIREQVGQQVAERIEPIASALALDRYGKTGRYVLGYPEDIQLFGLSFNTQLGASGWALQGEYSFRRDAPLQKAERVVFAEGLAPILRTLDSDRPDHVDQQDVPEYLAAYQPARIQGYIERDVSQIQATATKVFGPTIGADAFVFVTELALMHVHDMPDKNTSPLESPAGGTLAEGKADADGTSWGYRVAARLDYNNAIGGANLHPYTQFLHDVTGNSPAPSGPFVEGRTALTLGLRANYLSRWEADIGYTRYAGKGNELSDRDFVSASVKYSF